MYARRIEAKYILKTDEHMNEKTELSLEGFWIRPHSYVTYLEDDLFILVEFKNNSNHSIEIETITCLFEIEESLPEYLSVASPNISIGPKNISDMVRIPFKVDLKLHANSNYPTLIIKYRINKSVTKTIQFTNPYTRCIIINQMHLPEKHFFLSHKDPHNTSLATKLAHHLQKIGFIGYIAENDPRPGLDIWDEKIFPSIDTCFGLIVLWTSDTVKEPQTIIREVEYANKKQKRIILLAEKDIDIPELFLGTKEYLEVDGKITDVDLVNLVEIIEKIYRLGGFVN